MGDRRCWNNLLEDFGIGACDGF